jgi:RNA binding exosome subunit
MAEGGRSFDVASVVVSVLAHATEDEDKVERAVRNLFPEGAGEFRLKRQRLSGYYKDPIALITTRIRKRRRAVRTFRYIIGLLSPLDQQRLLDELEDRVDEAGNLYIRLDKQKAFRGEGALKEIDSIRLKFGFRVPHGRPPLEYIESVIVSLIEDGSGRQADLE